MNASIPGDSCFYKGFTLIEIMITLALFSIVMAVGIKIFFTQQNTLTHIDQRSEMQIEARNALHIIETHIQMMGFSPAGSLDAQDALDFSSGCRAEGGWLAFWRNDPDDIDVTQLISINLLKEDDDEGGAPDGFADSNVGATGLIIQDGRVADNIAAVRFAYAYDEDKDGAVDMSANENIIWAIDADRDGQLDMSLDTDDDGDVDSDDAVGGMPLPFKVDISRIRAVKVWLLVRSPCPLKGARDKRVFVVGDRRYAADDYYGHVLVTTTIRCRNIAG